MQYAIIVVCNYKNKWKFKDIPAVKKCVAPKKAIVKKMWNPRWWLRNGCNGEVIAKILITTIQANLVLNVEKVTQIHLNCHY